MQRRERGILGNGRTERGPLSLSMNQVSNITSEDSSLEPLLIQRRDWEERELADAEKRERYTREWED